MIQDDDKVPIHEALNRPILMLGGERNLVLMLLIVAGVFIFSLAKLWAAAVGIAKKALYVVLGVAFIVLGNKFLAVLGLTGAMVA